MRISLDRLKKLKIYSILSCNKQLKTWTLYISSKLRERERGREKDQLTDKELRQRKNSFYHYHKWISLQDIFPKKGIFARD